MLVYVKVDLFGEIGQRINIVSKVRGRRTDTF